MINNKLLKIVLTVLLLSPPVEAIHLISNVTADTRSLSVSQLRRIYTMRQLYWQNGTPIVIYVLPSQAPLHQQFCKDKLALFPYQLDRIWQKLTFSGYGVAPIQVANQQALLQAVKTTKGAIGYVETLSEVKDVNVIQIDD
ncbi:hypothetical protein SAMN05216262_10729 [Colwellia chukchiensis]|uniref:PBP superfamily domain-containing protein n=1 Tax=Colwellia chukchiensis TaxID=641665 RepID=A0A1H7N5J8_9GAMM|nr:hypothetical protein [Colwellia chukchiensis]SEL18589.1 hypothetical protein SAMN05216262_10729 [Colwellia chukchiensis]